MYIVQSILTLSHSHIFLWKMVQGNQDGIIVTIFCLTDRLRRQNRWITEVVVLMGRADAIAAFTNQFGVNPFDVCDPESIREVNREQFFSYISLEEYSQGQNNCVIGM